MTLLFKDDFELGTFTKWTNSTTQGGLLVCHPDAAMHGHYGARFTIADSLQVDLFDQTPDNITRYRARFYFDPNSLNMIEGDKFTLFKGLDNDEAIPAFFLDVKKDSGVYKLLLSDYSDGDYDFESALYEIANRRHCIEIDWQASSAPAADDGAMSLYVDGVLQETVSSIDNDTESIGCVCLGAYELDAGTSGTFYVDDFESNDDGTEIGLVTTTFPSVKNIPKLVMCKTTKEVNGPWTADMQIKYDKTLADAQRISAEDYIDIPDGNVVETYIAKKVKRVKSAGKLYIDVKLDHIMSELAGFTIDRFYIKDTVNNHLDYILSGTGWSRGSVDIEGTVILDVDRRSTVLSVLYQLADILGGEYYFNSTRTVDFKYEIGARTKRQLRCDKNCTYMDREEDSTNLITRMYPYAPDNVSINTIQLHDCDDATLWTPSGASTATTVTSKKMEGSGCIDFTHSDGETLIIDIGALNAKDLTGYDLVELWVFDNTGSGLDFDANPAFLGIGESSWDDNKIQLTGTVNAGSWKKVQVDISAVADADKNTIRCIGFEGGGQNLYIDDIRAVGTVYLDSENIASYQTRKEAVFFHSANTDVTQKTIKIYPSDDAYVSEAAPTTNYGNSPALLVRDYTPASYESFMTFPLTDIPEGATIVSATLYMYCYKIINGGNSAVEILALTGTWLEDTVTWNTKPASGALITTVNLSVLGWETGDMTAITQGWFSGATNNKGVRIRVDVTPDENKVSGVYSKEASSRRPYLQVVYSTSNTLSDILSTAAQAKLAISDEPALKYNADMADLSRAITSTWKDEIVNLGDTVRMYDEILEINTDCRIKKIVKDLLKPDNTNVELTNRAYDISDLEARLLKMLKYAMPFEDCNAIYANAIKEGYLGDVE